MTKVVTRGEYTGLSDRYSAGVLVHDYSKQKTPKSTVKPKQNKVFGGSIQETQRGTPQA
ncbi:hypothetical protein [Ruegeria sp. HKCCD7221]|uniref:hypothetical protein n=1 Tax=Ruegeria sp. HKCCD7221 TaxID=2683009 RepID=UPI00147EB670|nr:hypothetical protein [Ruegeria sp. HKCCD7221]